MEVELCLKEIIDKIVKRESDRKYYLNKRKNTKYKSDRAKHMMKYRRTCNGKYKTYINSAIAKNQEWNISFDYFKMIISDPCWYCGDTTNIGIDRGYNNVGYIVGNCVSCCTDCNLMKNKRDINVFLYKCKLISNRLQI